MRRFSISLPREKDLEFYFRAMRSRIIRPIALLLCVLLLANTSVKAGPVAFSEVVQIVGRYQNPPELRLRFQTGIAPIPGAFGWIRTGSNLRQSVDDRTGKISSAAIPPHVNGPDSLLEGIGSTNNPQTSVEVISQGDVEGTVCDCGEIMVLGGGFPKWPLIFLAAIPFFFINHGHNKILPPPPTITPTPTPTPTVPVPEPASLLLFGSGLLALGASFRRRYGQRRPVVQADVTEGS